MLSICAIENRFFDSRTDERYCRSAKISGMEVERTEKSMAWFGHCRVIAIDPLGLAVQLYEGRSRLVVVKDKVLGGSSRTLTAVSSALFMELSWLITYTRKTDLPANNSLQRGWESSFLKAAS